VTDLGVTDLDDRAAIEELVVAFYRAVATDDVLGPVFLAADVEWSAHVPKLVDFWAWQLLGERGYEGNPLRAHEPVHARTPFTPEHYGRWLELFEETLDERFRGSRAEQARNRARRMAHALQRLMDGVSASGEAPIEAMVARHRAG
jgi:hemoglobin